MQHQEYTSIKTYITLLKPIPIISKNFTDIWPVANVRLVTDIDSAKICLPMYLLMFPQSF